MNDPSGESMQSDVTSSASASALTSPTFTPSTPAPSFSTPCAVSTAASPLRCAHALATASVTADKCANCASRQQRAALVSQYLREALPPISSPVFVLPNVGQLVLSCDARLPEAPYVQDKSNSGKMSAVAARRRVSRMAVQWLRQDRQLQANLMWAVRFNDTDRVRQLISMGADVNEPDALGRTALHVAASQGFTDMVQLLLSAGARPDPQDRRQNTPLHLAVCTSRWGVIQRLLAAGADVWSTNGSNMSALQLARSKLNMVLRLKTQGTLDFDKHIEELRAVHDLVQSALASAPAGVAAAPAAHPHSLASLLDQIEQLNISGEQRRAAPAAAAAAANTVAEVNAELRAMHLSAGDARDKLKSD